MSSQQPSVAQRFGEHLRSVRVAAGLTQDDVAAMMVDRGFKWIQTTVTKTEGGRRPIQGLDEYVALCELLSMDPGLTLTIARGPQIPRDVKLAELRAQIAAKTRELERVRDVAHRGAEEIQELATKLARLEADA